MAKKCMLFHSESEYNNEQCGENVFCFQSDNNNINGSYISTLWYNEIKNYDFNIDNDSEGKRNNFNNFTQLIWKDTKEVGFGFMKSNKGIYYIVANYYPSGNIKGKYKENVLPII